ncbi:MAG: hypothetical protein M5R36_26100 [Deltaproteobacteria bacterium]|nr:hypothetical protein [Deltaproteobacteria bacterium]
MTSLDTGEIIFKFNYDDVRKELALRGEEEIEPLGTELTYVRFGQVIGDIPFLDGSVFAIFDDRDRLISIGGEYLGLVDAPRTQRST